MGFCAHLVRMYHSLYPMSILNGERSKLGNCTTFAGAGQNLTQYEGSL